ncbi:hypothetical protein [Ottowia thiooxydans]|uniref:hypothetical protein n=1 Tax=Ottowia thiooxydans TaxID=219182 RepID=UPI000411C1E8|nr:hypothetical protein [Ottowia thiooxydans]
MRSLDKRSRHSLWIVWRMPLLLGVLTVFGLLLALLGDGTWRWASWLALASPVLVAAWFGLRS